MTMFRSKKNKAGKSQSYPIKPSRKTPKHYSSGKPSWGSRTEVHSDIKKMHRQDDPASPQNHGKEHDLYKRRLAHESDKQYIKETKKANKKQNKMIKKDEKDQIKEAIKNEKGQDEKEKQQDDEIRHDASTVDGNDRGY